MLKPKIYSFETLEVWKEARRLSVKIYKLTKRFPPEEKFGITSQMRRSVTSIMRNLAEGASRTSLLDQSRFTEISFGSLLELLSDTILTYDLKYVSEDELIDLRLDYDSIGTKLDGLQKSQLDRHQKGLSGKFFKKF